MCSIFCCCFFFGAVIGWQASVVMYYMEIQLPAYKRYAWQNFQTTQHSTAQHNTAHNVFHLAPNRNQPTWIVNSMKITLLNGITFSKNRGKTSFIFRDISEHPDKFIHACYDQYIEGRCFPCRFNRTNVEIILYPLIPKPNVSLYSSFVYFIYSMPNGTERYFAFFGLLLPTSMPLPLLLLKVWLWFKYVINIDILQIYVSGCVCVACWCWCANGALLSRRPIKNTLIHLDCMPMSFYI